MNEQEGRRRLGAAIKADRLRLYGTVEAARVANGVKVSRGTWDKAERGDVITEYKLADIERALGWDSGRSASYLNPPDPDSIRAQVEASDLAPDTKALVLDALENIQPTPPIGPHGEVTGA